MRILAMTFIVAMAGGANAAVVMKHHHAAHGHMMSMKSVAPDTRRMLEAPAGMKEHQKANMREHLRAVQKIMALMAQDKW